MKWVSLQACNNLVTTDIRRRLHVSNPVIPKLYCLPKIHKPGKSVRPIVSAIDAPTSKLSKWLTSEFNNLPIQQPSFSVKNSLEFIKAIQNIQLLESEILISFDVSSLFPSVPIPETLTYLKDLLIQNDLSQQCVEEYIRLTDICMKQNIFQLNGSFYEQQEGTAMGNSLSPFLANLFMSRFEKDLESSGEYFPRVWLRYVDDIFAIFDTKNCNIDDFINSLNNRFETIKFTYEKEEHGQLPFLDTLVIRNKNCLEFDVYRKETSTLRYIPSDSHHCAQHKMASLNFLVHRLLTFPLNKVRYEKELEVIKHGARCNGFQPQIIYKLIRKFNYRNFLKESTTFREEVTNTPFVTLPFAPSITKGLSKIFKGLDLGTVYSSGTNLRSLIGNPKDKVQPLEKSGIYEISCKNCNQKYIGQTRRSISTRFKEHMANLKHNRIEKSSVAQHIFENDHNIDHSNVKLIRPISNCKFLNVFESLEIYKNKSCLMNSDNGPIPHSSLFSLM